MTIARLIMINNLNRRCIIASGTVAGTDCSLLWIAIDATVNKLSGSCGKCYVSITIRDGDSASPCFGSIKKARPINADFREQFLIKI